MNMHLHLFETTIKTILGTILKNSIENFSYIQYLAYLNSYLAYLNSISQLLSYQFL